MNLKFYKRFNDHYYIILKYNNENIFYLLEDGNLEEVTLQEFKL